MPHPTVLSISSQVAYGHVGNSATIAALQTLNCTVIDIPTIILSSHPGHGANAAIDIPAEKIDEILNILEQQGRLDKVDGVISGYIRSPEQVDVIRKAVENVKSKNPAALYFCDPVIGDDLPGIYVPGAVAEAIKTRLVPASDILVPNLFEFQFLTGDAVSGINECIELARTKFKAQVLITSVPMQRGTDCGNLLVGPRAVWLSTNPRIDKVPHGTGDLLTGLFAGHYLSTHSSARALSYACGQLNSVLIKSIEEGGDELVLSPLMTPPNLYSFSSAQRI